ncbi:NUDIX hydrolase [Gymnodinialimonas hymeniacidonis]|uniref:NUDIX hydrolase n=1 Tax=Gymnodinialimonas hymeniacidonis TaxID=3126508 RepID=UPI0034C69797
MAEKTFTADQPPLRLRSGSKRDPRTQFAGLPYRTVKKGGEKVVEVLLVTSRYSQRWILPKGWPMDGMTPAEAAAQEVWEEAGARGDVHDICLGLYTYDKWMSEAETLPIIVAVFPIRVRELAEDYPEVGQRRRKWMSLKKAANKVEERDLKQLIRSFSLERLR